jgi:hypothetical protein
MGEFVLIWIGIVTAGFIPTVLLPPPVYFHDRSACEAAIIALQDPENKGIKLGGRCLATRTGEKKE